MQDFFLTKYMLIYDQDLLLPLQVLQNNGSKTSALTSYTATLPMIQPMKTFSWVGMTYGSRHSTVASGTLALVSGIS